VTAGSGRGVGRGGQRGRAGAGLPLVVSAAAGLLDPDDDRGGAALDDHGPVGRQHAHRGCLQQRDLLLPAALAAMVPFGGPQAHRAACPLGHGAQFVFRRAAENDLGFVALPDNRSALDAV